MKQDGHVEETRATSNLNTNDLGDVSDVNRLSVDEIQCEEAIPNLIKKNSSKQLFHTRRPNVVP